MCSEPGCSGIVTAEQQSREDENATIQMHQLYFFEAFSIFEAIPHYRLHRSCERYISMVFGLLLKTYSFSEHAARLFGKNRDHVQFI
jgi:hypothetical protein